jgi:hypothetical protein
LDDTVYITKIQPVLEGLSKSAIANTLGVTKDYAYEIVRIPAQPNAVSNEKPNGIPG